MDPMSPGMPGGGMPPPPPMGGPMGGPVSPAGGPPPAGPPPMGGLGNDPHDKIIEALRRIEDKLAQIAAKLGA